MAESQAFSIQRALQLGTIAAVLSSLFLPILEGYGTQHRMAVSLFGWELAQTVSGAGNSDPPLALSMMFAGLLNTLAFFVPALLIWLVCRGKYPVIGRNLLVGWCVVFLLTFFVLFPATDGP